MDMWQALQYVGTGLSLVAFVVAALLVAYRTRLTQRAEIIKSAPDRERLEAIAATAEFFRVDVSGLTRAQQQDIVLTQIAARARRDLLWAGLSLVVAILLAVIALAAIWTSRPAETASKPTDTTSKPAETESLIQYYNARAKDIEHQMSEVAQKWEDDPREFRSLQLLIQKQQRFKELHQRHVEALRAGHLTLAQVHANAVNQFLTGKEISYNTHPGFQEFRTTYIDRKHDLGEVAITELIRVLSDASSEDWARLSAAELIMGQCNNDKFYDRYRLGQERKSGESSTQCVAGMAALFEYPESYYALWQGASITLCEAGANAQGAIPSLIKVLSERNVYKDWRSWIFAMRAIGCIGPSAGNTTPYIIEVLNRPNPEPNKYYNIQYIQENAIKALAKLGKGATNAIPDLQKITTEGRSQELRNAASKAIQDIQE